MKKILILGGTQFIGRNLVNRLLELGQHEITLFNRQQTHAHLFPDVQKIRGDRETADIKQIAREEWDYIVDLSCYYPDALSGVLESLTTKPDKYLLISTCSVYDNHNDSQLKDENAPVLPCDHSQRTDRSAATYGHRKAECERVLISSGLHYTILRPALVYGPFDHTDRLYYWLYQVKHKPILLLPDNGNRTFSMTYVGDLVEAIIRSLSPEIPSGVCNVISYPSTSIMQIVSGARELLQRQPAIVNAPAAALHEMGINEWTDMPLWLDSDTFTYSNQKLRDDLGIELTTLRDSLRETILYCNTLGWPEPEYGMTEQTRLELIERVK